MIPRILQLPDDDNVFLFGPRGTGKTMYIKGLPHFSQMLYINLLRFSEENRFARNPDELYRIVEGIDDNITHIVIDEIQKLPKLLDIVHDIIETSSVKFILTGSSARRLKREGVNLLAGRAFVYHLHPFTFAEVADQFQLHDALHWGMLPKVFEYNDEDKKRQFLEAYTNTYLKEEIWVEQFVRNLEPFRYFLRVAAQCNGKEINFANIARDVGVSNTTVMKYYGILEDTLIGFFLHPFQHSFRKRLNKTPKFYFFDPGIVRSLTGHLTVPLVQESKGFGDAFEHFIILQCKALIDYYHTSYHLSFIKTKDGAEVDLVVERPGQPYLFIEIKSTDNVRPEQVTTLKQLANDFGDCEAVCLSRDPYPKQIDTVKVLPWQQGLISYFS